MTRTARRNRGLGLGISLAAALLGVASCSDKRPLILVSVSRTAEVQADATISISFDERIVDSGVPLPSPGSFVDHGYWLANWDGGVVRVHLALNGKTSAGSSCDFDWTNATSGKIIWIAGLATPTCRAFIDGGQGGASGTGGQADAGADLGSNPPLGGRGGGGTAGTAGVNGTGGAAGSSTGGAAGGAGSGETGGAGTGGVGTGGVGGGGVGGGTPAGTGTGGRGGVGGRAGGSGGGPGTGGLTGGGGVPATGGVGAAGSGVGTGGMVGTGGIVGTGGMVATGGSGGAGGTGGTGGAAGSPVNCNPPGTGGQAGAATGGAGGAGCSANNPTAICTCSDYCAAFTKNCQGGSYFPMNDCVETCASFHWQSSTYDDFTQDLSCRATYAMAGGQLGCTLASPTGGDRCGGSHCDNFCQTVAQNCGALDPYPSTAACKQACQSFDYPDERLAICGNTYNCRLYWAAEAGRAGTGQATACQYAGVNSPACQ